MKHLEASPAILLSGFSPPTLTIAHGRSIPDIAVVQGLQMSAFNPSGKYRPNSPDDVTKCTILILIVGSDGLNTVSLSRCSGKLVMKGRENRLDIFDR